MFACALFAGLTTAGIDGASPHATAYTEAGSSRPAGRLVTIVAEGHARDLAGGIALPVRPAVGEQHEIPIGSYAHTAIVELAWEGPFALELRLDGPGGAVTPDELVRDPGRIRATLHIESHEAGMYYASAAALVAWDVPYVLQAQVAYLGATATL